MDKKLRIYLYKLQNELNNNLKEAVKMAIEVKKSVLYIYGTKEDGDTRRRSYRNLVNNVGAEKLSAFGKIIGELSGEETQDIEIVETSMVKD